MERYVRLRSAGDDWVVESESRDDAEEFSAWLNRLIAIEARLRDVVWSDEDPHGALSRILGPGS